MFCQRCPKRKTVLYDVQRDEVLGYVRNSECDGFKKQEKKHVYAISHCELSPLPIPASMCHYKLEHSHNDNRCYALIEYEKKQCSK